MELNNLVFLAVGLLTTVYINSRLLLVAGSEFIFLVMMMTHMDSSGQMCCSELVLNFTDAQQEFVRHTGSDSSAHKTWVYRSLELLPKMKACGGPDNIFWWSSYRLIISKCFWCLIPVKYSVWWLSLLMTCGIQSLYSPVFGGCLY